MTDKLKEAQTRFHQEFKDIVVDRKLYDEANTISGELQEENPDQEPWETLAEAGRKVRKRERERQKAEEARHIKEYESPQHKSRVIQEMQKTRH